MKKSPLLFAGSLFCLILLAGCSPQQSDFKEKTYSADTAGISAVNIDVKDRKINISPSSDDQIHITYHENEKEFYNITAKDSTLSMQTETDKKAKDFFGRNASLEDRTIDLSIPDSLISSLKISTTNENINFPSLSITDSVSAYANNGNITFESLAVGKSIQLETKNGSISGTVVGGYDDFLITSNIKKGDSNLPEQAGNGTKTLNVKVNNGDVQIDFQKSR